MQCPACQRPVVDGKSFCEACGANVTARDPMVGRTFGGKYLLQQRLGQGGFGAVYAAEEARLQRRVAIKTLHRHLSDNPQLVQRFHQEAVAASRLEHPNIVKIYDIGDTEDGILWMAMEFLSGRAFDAYLSAEGPLAPGVLLPLALPICEALAEAHRKGIIHRDLKPQNIMLVDVGGRLVPKVLDFGISKLADTEGQTASGAVMGTPQFMPPEQWEGAAKVTPASDVYSLGVILYYALSKRFPVRGTSPSSWMSAHLQQAPAPLAPYLAGHPGAAALESVVLRALAKDPLARYASAAELRTALEEAQAALSTSTTAPALRALPPAVEETLPPRDASGGAQGLSGAASLPRCGRCEVEHAPGSPECPAGRLGRLVAGKYSLVRLMGAGGMGAVYEAEHLTLKKRVALKMLLPRYAANLTINRRFEEEARSAASLKHPNVIEVSDLGRDADGSAFMEMELLRGHSVAALVRQGPLPLEQALTIFTEALEGLAFAHRKGIVHRDLKPDNLFYAESETGEFHAKILDFGIAKLQQDERHDLTQTNSMMGTPVYMSPEQATDSKRANPRSDLYSMGATLFEMLTGRRALSGETLNELLTKLIEDRVERSPRQYRPEIPEWVDRLVARALAKDPEARPSSAEEMVSILRAGRADPQRALSLLHGGSLEALPAPVAPAVPASLPAPPPQARGALGWGLGGVAVLAILGAALLLWPRQGAAPVAPPRGPVVASGPSSQAPLPVPAPACAPLREAKWQAGRGTATAGPGESDAALCARALQRAREDAIRGALCLGADEPAALPAPPTTDACKAELGPLLQRLSWRARLLGERDVKTSLFTSTERACSAEGSFRVAPRPARASCSLEITSTKSVIKSYKKGDATDNWRFLYTPESTPQKAALYLVSVLPNGIVYPFWDLTGATKVQGKIRSAEGIDGDFAQGKFAPLMAGAETTTYSASLLEPGQAHSCEILLAVALPEAIPFHVELFEKETGDVIPRLGGFFSALDQLAGAPENYCWTFQPYEVIP